MLRFVLLLLVIPSALFLLTACGGPAPTPNIPIGPAATEPAPPAPTETMPATPTEPAPTNTPPATSTPVPEATPEATNTPVPPTATPQPTATEPRPTVTEPPATATPAPMPSAPEDVAAIRRIVYDYWVALNDYDVDLALTMLEPGYRADEEGQIRDDVSRMELFRIKLEISEETPPTLNADGDYETYIGMKTPVDSRRVLMVFRIIDGQWWIVYSEEVE